MTLLVNHRNTSYKKMRPLNHKKMCVPTARHHQKKMEQQRYRTSAIIAALQRRLENYRNKSHLPPPPNHNTLIPTTIMVARTIYVWDVEHHVFLPQDIDIYEGLRLWYPALHAAVMDEENWLAATPPEPTEEEAEEAWAHYDYLEWLQD